MARRRRERPEAATGGCSGAGSLAAEAAEEESAALVTPASGELFDVLWESGVEAEEPRASRMAATSSLLRIREVPLRPMEPASD